MPRVPAEDGKASKGVAFVRRDGHEAVWRLQARFKLPSGETGKIDRTLKGGTRREAEKSLQEERQKIKSEGIPTSRWTTMKDVLEGYEKYRAARVLAGALRAKTAKIEADIIRLHLLAPAEEGGIGHLRAAHLEPEHISKFYASLANKKPGRGGLDRHYTTASHAHTLLRLAFNWALKQRSLGIKADVMQLVDRPVKPAIRRKLRTDAGEGEYWSVEEQARLFAACLADPPNMHQYALAFALRTGLRVGEVYGLNRSDVEVVVDGDGVERLLLNIKRSTDMAGRDGPPKTRKSARKIQLLDDAKTVVERVRALQGDQRREFGWVDSEDGALFSNQLGKRNYYSNGRRHWQRACKTAGVPIKPFHSARHSFIYHCALVAKLPLLTVSLYCGHDSPQTTIKAYSYWTDAVSLDGAIQLPQPVSQLSENVPTSMKLASLSARSTG